MALHRLILLTILSCAGLLTFTTAGDAEGILKKPVECLVCGKLHSDADYVVRYKAQEMLFTSSGLTKIPSTRDERACPACGHANHPSARACNACRAPLTPAAPSEVELAGLRKES